MENIKQKIIKGGKIIAVKNRDLVEIKSGDIFNILSFDGFRIYIDKKGPTYAKKVFYLLDNFNKTWKFYKKNIG